MSWSQLVCSRLQHNLSVMRNEPCWRQQSITFEGKGGEKVQTQARWSSLRINCSPWDWPAPATYSHDPSFSTLTHRDKSKHGLQRRTVGRHRTAETQRAASRFAPLFSSFPLFSAFLTGTAVYHGGFISLRCLSGGSRSTLRRNRTRWETS